MKGSLRCIGVGLAVLWLAACGGGGGGSGAAGGSTGTAATSDPQVMLVDAFPNLSFTHPVALLQNPADPQRWYVVQREGLVKTFSGADADTSSNFLDLSGSVATEGEGGLLGMAFHPDFGANGQFYVDYTVPGPDPLPLTTHVSRFLSSAGGVGAIAGSEEILLSIDQPYANHNGGWIAFGPDRYFYIGLGDGGSAGDPNGNGQNPHTLFGSILRIDVDYTEPGRPYAIPLGNPFSASPACSASDNCPEIFAWGFRNPWRGSFDAPTDDLWIGDVGQDAWEEVDLVRVGENYGWNILEGNHCYPSGPCQTAGLTAPVAEYGHDVGDAVTGGYVYRGTDIPGLTGDYIYGDFGSGRIWRLVGAASGGNQAEVLIDSGLQVVSFGQDINGEIYVIDFAGGHIYRLAPSGG
jgi:glucose/arabinose dehydrogenase